MENDFEQFEGIEYQPTEEESIARWFVDNTGDFSAVDEEDRSTYMMLVAGALYDAKSKAQEAQKPGQPHVSMVDASPQGKTGKIVALSELDDAYQANMRVLWYPTQ